MSSSTRRAFALSAVLFFTLSLVAQRPRNGMTPPVGPKPGLPAPTNTQRGYELYDGDIIRDRPVQAPRLFSHRPMPYSVTTAYSQYLWPKANGVATVYFVIDSASDPNATPKINAAVSIFNGDFPGLIQWVPWTSSVGPNYVDINLSASDTSGVCEAVEGYEAEPAQPVTGSTDCAVSTILHEMGHVIGLWHEQTRADRDTYLTVNYNNVIKGSWSNFQIVSDNDQILGLFDYASIMEYEPYSFSRNGGPVIETVPAGIPLTNTEGVPVPTSADYSAGDKEAIQRLYGAAPAAVTITSNPVGLQVEVDGATVITPQTYSWALNSTHTLNVPSGVQTLAGDIEGSTTSSTFYYTYGRWNDNMAQSHTITVTPGNGSQGFPATSPMYATYSANFVELVPYSTSVYPSGSGDVAVSPQPQSYPGASGLFFVARQQATLTATPSSGYNFYEFNNAPYWLPGGLSANPKTFYVPDTGNPVDTTVYFTPNAVYTLDVTPEPFSSNLGALADGGFWYTPKNFSSYYDSNWTAGSSHTLDIDSPQYPYSYNSRYAFSQWSDGGAQSHTISSLPATSTNYVATVIPQFSPATNFSYPPCGGTGSISPSSPTSDGFYPAGQPLSFSATPVTGWTFAGWTYDLAGTANPAGLTANDESLVFANFNTAETPLTLASLSPSSVLAGGKAFTLTLNGTGFTANSVVFINNQYRASTFVNAQQLQVAMTAADIATAKDFQIFVENYPSGWNGCAVYGALTFAVQGTQPASMLSPAPGSKLSGSSVTFSWTTGSGATAYWIYVGTTGPASSNIYSSGSTTQTSLNVGGIPTFGENLYVTLFSSINGSWRPVNYLFAEAGTYTLAAMTNPAPRSTLAGSTVTFTWSAGVGPTMYYLYLGTTGIGSSNVYNSGNLSGTSVTVSGVPAGGGELFVTLFSRINNAWAPVNYTYVEAGTPVLATMTNPSPGGTLPGSSATFQWTTGSGVTAYYLYVGTTPGTSNVYNSGSLGATSVLVTNLPTNGVYLYITLFSLINGAWKPASYTVTEAGTYALAAMTSPIPGSTLSGSSVTFTWSQGVGSGGYWLFLGSTGAGSSNLYSSGSLSGTSVTVNGLPTNGERIYATLFTSINRGWKPVSYTYTAAP